MNEFRIGSSLADRAKFDEWIEGQINEDQEIGGYDAESYAGEMLGNLDLTDDRETAEDEGRPWVDDLEEAEGRVKSVVAKVLPVLQAERTEVESEDVADWPDDSDDPVKCWIGEDGMGDGWEALPEEERAAEMERLGRLCIEYGADEWEACPETMSYPYRNTAEALDIVGLAFAAWCGGEEVD